MAAKKLQADREKRDFSRTGEPVGSDAGNRFVVHKQSATSDHYDLRLQVGGAGLPRLALNPADKRLAVETIRSNMSISKA